MNLSVRNIGNIGNIVTRLGGRTLLLGKKYSPQILTGVGVVSGVTSTVLACRATVKAQPILEETRFNVLVVKENKEGAEHYRKDLTAAYTRGALHLAKVYGPAVSIGVFGIACVVSGHGILHQRNTAITAAYVAVDKAFGEYRQRVEAALGADREQELRLGLKEHRKDDTKKGEVVVEKVVDPNIHTLYAKFFDESNPNWSKNAEYNMVFLRNQQQYANDLLQARGHVFLNDVYDSLGIERTSAGSVVGWVLSKDGGDNFVDFGLYRGGDERVRMFVNGDEWSILLDFNVDGVIFDKI